MNVTSASPVGLGILGVVCELTDDVWELVVKF